MKLKAISLSLFVLLFQMVFAQHNALLWKISGKGLAKPSYLFGTIHAYCDKDKFITDEFMKSFNSVDEVAMELNLNDFSTFVYLMKSSMKTTVRPISSYLNSKEINLLDSICRLVLGDSLKNLDYRTPMSLMGKMYLSDSILGCSPVPLDFIIAELAKRQNKSSFGLESPHFQDSLLSSISDSIQITWLIDLAKDMSKAKSDFRSLIAAYNTQDADSIYQLAFKTSPEMVLLKDAFLDYRNQNWVKYLISNMSSKSIFMAVGAAHLSGDMGLIELIRRAGFQVEPIKIEFKQ